ncbi:MAG: phosphocholine cytidylyltransferase family protein [Rhodospirillaceae bacterium]|jgi:choline kinase|nr:phosphocholine cytidylyltransferase family protein [Rhodospirillaceae bacterium]MBT3887458.1 phosphocholine cytidylyltransferase family protein [Rhodospirillaceae bacterium]MBT4116301.1 phosphocholine cytidylyltransferase family protein [Rhodospirillaceae bacterium]MBT4671363.1 phosphocholine cytidylyltransferase family protein [Rhodospirillaceae bacterium]MBT4719428.1 phosphocholine cytidylyltransferase family protein [Rhodospirillaceae bacterium]
MKALMLAAGTGSRLSGGNDGHSPKALLKFGGQSLLARHLDHLSELGIQELALVVGYRSAEIIGEIDQLGAAGRVTIIQNDEFRQGSSVSLWCARQVLVSGEDVLFMDADVLYHEEMLRRLLDAEAKNCFTFDAQVDDDDEPVKLCIRGGHPVEFRKKISGQFDRVGEWPGFLKLSAEMAAKLAERLDQYMDAGRTAEPYEEAIRDLLAKAVPGTFAIAEISGVPWIEIDFDEDLRRAEDVILPAIEKFKPTGGD